MTYSIVDDIHAIDKLVASIKKIYGRTSTKGTVNCPICGEDLHFTVAAFNGHVHGKCTTKDCLQWAE